MNQPQAIYAEKHFKPCSKETQEKYPHDCTCGSFRYTAQYEDGTTEVVRKKATSLYPFAWMYSKPLNGATHDGLKIHNFFKFGKVSDRYYRQYEIAQYKITLHDGQDPVKLSTHHVGDSFVGDDGGG